MSHGLLSRDLPEDYSSKLREAIRERKQDPSQRTIKGLARMTMYSLGAMTRLENKEKGLKMQTKGEGEWEVPGFKK